MALVIPTAPTITTQPVSQTVNVWQSASFTVAATGYPLNYQWRKDGVDLGGATSATYSLPLGADQSSGQLHRGGEQLRRECDQRAAGGADGEPGRCSRLGGGVGKQRLRPDDGARRGAERGDGDCGGR